MSKQYLLHVVNINNNPYQKDAYLNIINYLRTTTNELDLLSKDDNIHKYRMIFIEYFLPNKSFWLDWIDDYLLTITSNHDSITVTSLNLHDLFKKAIQNLPDFELIMKYIDVYNLKYNNDEITMNEMRDIYEYCILHGGFDMVTSSEIWKKYQEFEIDLLEDYLDDIEDVDKDVDNQSKNENNSNVHQKLKEKFISCYTRQLSIPLIGNEATLKDFEQKLSKYCIESDISIIQPEQLQKKVSVSNQLRESRLIYEMKYYSDAFQYLSEEEKIKFWFDYIEYEINVQQYSRVQRLYERSVIDANHNNSMKMFSILWMEYISFTLCKLKNWVLLRNILHRTIKIFRNYIYLWKLLLFSIDQPMNNIPTTNNNIDNNSLLNELQIAISIGSFQNMEDYYDLYFMYCHSYQRKLKITYQKIKNYSSNKNSSNSNNMTSEQQVNEKLSIDLKLLQEGCQQMLLFLQSYCNNNYYLLLWTKWCKYYANLEYSLLQPILIYIESITNNTIIDDNDNNMMIDEENNKNLIEFSSKKNSKINKSDASKSNKTITPGIEIWELGLKYFPDSSYLYLEYMEWLKSIHEYESCTRLFKKMLNLKLDMSTEEIIKIWIGFEQEYGGYEDIQSAWIRSYPLLKKTSSIITTTIDPIEESTMIATEGTIANNITAITSSSNNREGDEVNNKKKNEKQTEKKNNKRKLDDPVIESNSIQDNTHPDQQQQPYQYQVNDLFNKKEDEIIDKLQQIEEGVIPRSMKKVKFSEENEIKIIPIEPPTAQNINNNNSKEYSKLLNNETVIQIRNFPFTASMESIQPFILDKCNSIWTFKDTPITIEHIKMLLSKAGKSRGIIEISVPVSSTDKDIRVQDLLEAFHNYQYNDRNLIAEIIKKNNEQVNIDKEQSSSSIINATAGSSTSPHLTTVFVNKFNISTTNEDLKSHFKDCGELLAVKISLDKVTKISKCCGLVQFSDMDGRDKALKLNKTILNGDVIAVTPSRFSLVQTSNNSNSLGGNSNNNSNKSNNTSTTKYEKKNNSMNSNDSNSNNMVLEKDNSSIVNDVGVNNNSNKDNGVGVNSNNMNMKKVVSTTSIVAFKPRGLIQKQPKAKIQL